MSEHFSKGRHYEDFVVGDVFRHWPGKTILDADNHWFTLLTMNCHPIHFDEVYAAEGELRKPLVNSAYTLALVTGTLVPRLAAAACDVGPTNPAGSAVRNIRESRDQSE